jgi:hypothetical protein
VLYKSQYRDKSGKIFFEEGLKSIKLSGVSKKFGEWYQKTNKTEDTNKLNLLAFKIITTLHNTLLAKLAPFTMLFRRGNRKKSTHRTPMI